MHLTVCSFWPIWLNSWVFVYELSESGFESHCNHLNFRYHACFGKGVSCHSGNYGLCFTLKRVRDMIRTSSQMHRTDRYSQHSSIIWPVELNRWVFVHELSGREFEYRCSHLDFRYRVCFEHGVRWHSGNYKVWIYFETRTWHDKHIQAMHRTDKYSQHSSVIWPAC